MTIASKNCKGEMGPEHVKKLDAFGFVAGEGGTVTQLTDKSTAVTLNKRCGAITMHNSSLAAATTVVFILNNTFISSSDVLIVNITGGATYARYRVGVDDVQDGLAVISLRNEWTGALGEAVVIGFAVIKAVVT